MEIYINLPRKDLERAKRFYNDLGFETKPEYSDDTATNAMISEHIVVMLLTETAGAQPWMNPMDEGSMYGRSFQDPDGHVWEVFHMDTEQAPGS
jgi:uncharacterized protein